MTQRASRTGAMAQFDAMHRESPKHGSPTVEQLLRGEGTKWSPHPSPSYGREHDMEDDHVQPQKKSVLAKVKEKARKWRNTLSKKKNNEENATPSWGVSLEDDEDEDPEYLGAPMYESEMAPEGYKETARQNPRAVPVIPEKHVLSSKANIGADLQKTNSPRSPIVKKPMNSSVTGNQDAEKPTKTLTETVSEKLAPAYATVTDATQALASKIQSLTISTNSQTPAASDTASYASPDLAASSSKAPSPLALSFKAPSPVAVSSTAPAPVAASTKAPAPVAASSAAPAPIAASAAGRSPGALGHKPVASSAVKQDAPGSAPAAFDRAEDHSSATDQMWDKGVSVKQYIMHKLEPGEEERALSQVISEAISPRRSPSDVGVVEKVREAVSSLLKKEESPRQRRTVYHSAQNSSSHIPISTNAHEVVEEETQGRILQAN